MSLLEKIFTSVKADGFNANVDLINPGLKFDNIHEAMAALIDFFVFGAAIWSLFALIYAAILYITSGGDSKKAETGKKLIIWTLTGDFFVLLSAALVIWIAKILTGQITGP